MKLGVELGVLFPALYLAHDKVDAVLRWVQIHTWLHFTLWLFVVGKSDGQNINLGEIADWGMSNEAA
jgi:hypothetical protein